MREHYEGHLLRAEPEHLAGTEPVKHARNGDILPPELASLVALVARGGPDPSEFPEVARAFQHLHAASCHAHIQRAFEATIVEHCIHGWANLKPYGYSGDHVIIDRLYTNWVSADPHLAGWDRFCQAQPAAAAVRNRKQLFLSLLCELTHKTTGDICVLNVASGPARDVLEFMQGAAAGRVRITCLDNDAKALGYAAELCREHRDRVQFRLGNALRFRSDERFDLIWSAGLFDYFSDRQFVRVARRLYSYLRPGGELVIGNFSDANPSRAVMEALLDWHLHHRSAQQLRELARTAGVPDMLLKVIAEPEGVNLFVRMTAAG